MRPPSTLTREGRREWLRLVKVLTDAGVLSAADMGHFEDMCRAVTDLRTYERAARKAGLDVAIQKGYANQIIKLRSQLTQLRAHLGLTPSSRSGVSAKGIAPAGSKLNAFLSRPNQKRHFGNG